MLLALKGEPIVQQVVDYNANNITNHRCDYHVDLPQLHKHNQEQVSAQCCRYTNQDESKKLCL